MNVRNVVKNNEKISTLLIIIGLQTFSPSSVQIQIFGRWKTRRIVYYKIPFPDLIITVYILIMIKMLQFYSDSFVNVMLMQ